MANILDLVTIGEKSILVVDASPAAGGGTSAVLGTVAIYDTGTTAFMYIKNGSLDTEWDTISTVSVTGTVSAGVAGRLALYPASGNTVDDVYVQNSQSIDVELASQPTRSTGIVYTIPNPGDAIAAADFILSEGTLQTINSSVVVNGDFTVHGTLTTLDTTNTTITDKLLTLNKGGLAASAGGSGLEFEENALITGYLKVSADRTGYDFLAPAGSFAAKLSLANLTAARTAKFADFSGTFVMRPDGTPGVSSQVAYFNGTDSLVSSAGFTWVAGVLTSANMTISSLGLGIAHVSAAGVISSSAVSLTSEVSGILPVANGGTNSSTALNNNRIMVSSAGAIVEAAALTNGQLLIGSTGAAPVAANITQGANQGVTIANGAGSIALSTVQDIRTTASPTFLAQTLSGVGAFWEIVDAADMKVTTATVNTTNATVTTLATVATVTDTVMLLEVKITGLRTGGTAGVAGDSATYIRTARIKNVAGVVSIQNLQSDYTSEDQAGFNGTITVSGTNALVQVQGTANNNMTWKAVVTKTL